MKDDIRVALETGREMTARELSERIQPESIQRLHEALSSMKKAGEIENGNDRMPGEPGGLSGKGARPSKTYRLADIDHSGALIERMDISCAKTDDTGELGFFSKTTAAAIGQGTSADIIALEKMSAAGDDDERFDDELEWARGANSRAAAYQAEAAADSHGGDEFDENDIAILIHGHEEMMLTYADGQLGGDKVWSLMRQQYQALQEL